jgi:transcriptional regulator with XRE-family HTH domain
MLSVGKTLKRARLEQGLDLSKVAAQTKISAKYLEAIESDDRTILPSGFFYRSFVEQYAKTLSLDTQEIDAEIDRMLSADAPLPLPGFESVVARNLPPMSYSHRFPRRRPYKSIASLVLVVVGCSGVYGWWHGGRSPVSVKGMIDYVRGFARPAVKQPKTVAQAKVAQPSPKIVDAKPVDTKTVASIAPAPKPTLPASVPVSLASNVKPVNTDPVAASDYKVMLDLMAHEATWLSVSSDGKPVFSGVLQANETKSVGGKQFAKLRVGNAAGIDVRLNGKLLGPLGARGQVLIVLFTPDNFQIVSPPKESD